MTSKTFVDGETVVDAAWLQDVNDAVYTPGTQTAADIANVPAGNIAATDVQTAINELDTEKQPKDATLTALAGALTAANKIPYATATDTLGELTLSTSTSLGTSDTTLSSQKAVKTYIDTQIAVIPAPLFTAAYTSPSPSTLSTNLMVSESHSLGATPTNVNAVLRCTTTDAGYAVGDEIHIAADDAPGQQNLSVWANATRVGVNISGTTRVAHKTTNATVSLTVANWVVVIRAWL